MVHSGLKLDPLKMKKGTRLCDEAIEPPTPVRARTDLVTSTSPWSSSPERTSRSFLLLLESVWSSFTLVSSKETRRSCFVMKMGSELGTVSSKSGLRTASPESTSMSPIQ